MTEQLLKMGDCRDVMRTLEPQSIDCVVTSPPYWGLRDYGTPPLIWDGDEDCEHEWGEPLKGHQYGRNDTNDPTTTNFGGWATWDGGTGNYAGSTCIKCGAWKGQLGLEPDPGHFVKHLCDIFDEVKRVLKSTGTCWIVIGDTYSSGTRQTGRNDKINPQGSTIYSKPSDAWIKAGRRTGIKTQDDTPPKSLVQIPSRFAIEMVNRGWILRNELIWHKPSCMPDSSKDRFTVDFEKVFFFVKSNATHFWSNPATGMTTDNQPPGTDGMERIDWMWETCPECGGTGVITEEGGYFSGAGGETECPRCKGGRGMRLKRSLWNGYDYWFEQQFEDAKDWGKRNRDGGKYTDGNPPISGGKHHGLLDGNFAKRGRNKRCVWSINPKPYSEAHFAVFPLDLIETPIRAGCPKDICVRCGLPRVPIWSKEVEKTVVSTPGKTNETQSFLIDGAGQKRGGFNYREHPVGVSYSVIGHTKCSCNAAFEPGWVLDPFCGSGTVLEYCRRNGYNAIGIELNEEYKPLAKKRAMMDVPRIETFSEEGGME